MNKDYELNSNYLRANLSLNNGNGAHGKHENGAGPFDMVSDEDLLGSNFDKISKILPN